MDNSSQLCEATNQICSVTFEGICRDHMLCQAEYIAMHYQRDLLDFVTFLAQFMCHRDLSYIQVPFHCHLRIVKFIQDCC